MPYEKLASAFRRHRVRFAYLWGSRARGRARPDSDTDIAVSLAPGASLEAFADLCSDVEDALGTGAVDVVLLEEANVLVRYLVQRDGVLIYELNPTARIAFACRARRDAWDEAPRWSRQARALERRLREGTFGR